MRFEAGTRIPSIVLAVFATFVIVFLSRSAVAQNKPAPGAGTPASSATPPAAGSAAAGTAPAAAPAEGNAQELLDKGQAALKAGDYAAALAAFNDALKAARQMGGVEGFQAVDIAQIGHS